MQAWIQRSSGSGGPPKGPAQTWKGKGKGKGKSKPSVQPWLAYPGTEMYRGPKRPRLDARSKLQRIEDLTRANSVLGLQTMRMVRILWSLGVVTATGPKCDATSDAVALVDERESNESSLLIQFDRWACLVDGLAQDTMVPADVGQVLAEHSASVVEKTDLFGQVKLCYCKPTFENVDIHLVQFEVDHSLSRVARALQTALVSKGFSVKYDPSPRSTAERVVADRLRSL